MLIFKLEGGVGHRTVPLLVVEAAFSGQVNNWSTQVENKRKIDYLILQEKCVKK